MRLKLELGAGRDVELVRDDARLGVLERPLELLRGHVHRQLVGGLGLDVVEDHPRVGRREEDDDRRDQGPGDLELRVAVDRLAVRLVARLRAVLVDAVAEHHDDDREDERREHDHHVQEQVDLVRLGRALHAVPVGDQHDHGLHDREDEHESDQLHIGGPSHRAAFYSDSAEVQATISTSYRPSPRRSPCGRPPPTPTGASPSRGGPSG